MSILSELFNIKPKFTISFKSIYGAFAVATPVVPASDIKSKWMQDQKDKPFSKKFNSCPGMLDYSQAGYIVTAYTNIHIKANSMGVIVKVDSTAASQENNHRLQPATFDYELVDNMTYIDKVKRTANKVPLPWTIKAKPGYSAYVLPALMHADYLDKIFVYPGVVDYDDFYVINFVFSPIKECEFTILAGTPLLQVIPFKREVITAECDNASIEDTNNYLFNIPARIANYYKKYLWKKKIFKISCPYKHRG